MVLGLLKIYEQRSCRGDSEREIVDCKALQGIHLELSLDLLDGIVIYKCPLFKCRDVVVVAVALSCAFFITSWNKKFLRGK